MNTRILCRSAIVACVVVFSAQAAWADVERQVLEQFYQRLARNDADGVAALLDSKAVFEIKGYNRLSRAELIEKLKENPVSATIRHRVERSVGTKAETLVCYDEDGSLRLTRETLEIAGGKIVKGVQEHLADNCTAF